MAKLAGKSLGITGVVIMATCSTLLFASTPIEEEPEENYYEPIVLTITAYSPEEEQTDDRPYEMASGRIATEEELGQMLFVAVDRKTMEKYGIEFGDTIWISFLVEDTMHKRITEGVDIFFKDEESAIEFGRQRRCVIIEKK